MSQPLAGRAQATAETIGTAIRDARLARDWKQSHLGRLVGVSGASVGQWERGETLPRADVLIALARLLDIDVRAA